MRGVAIALFVTLVMMVPAAPRAAATDGLLKVYTAAEREAIRQMPLEKRPNRIGHVYGNTIRRINKLGR